MIRAVLLKNEPNRVLRGGGWNYHTTNARVAHRSRYDPGDRNVDLGVRLVRFTTPVQQLAEVGSDEINSSH